MTWTKRSTDGIYTFEHDGQQVDVMMNGRCQHPAVIAQAIHDVLRVLDEVDGDPARLDINARDSGRGATEDNPYTFGPPCADSTGRFIFRHGQPAGYAALHEIPFMPDLANDICDVLWRHEQAVRGDQ